MPDFDSRLVAAHVQLHGLDESYLADERLTVSLVPPDQPLLFDIDGVQRWATAAQWAAEHAPVEKPELLASSVY